MRCWLHWQQLLVGGAAVRTSGPDTMLLGSSNGGSAASASAALAPAGRAIRGLQHRGGACELTAVGGGKTGFVIVAMIAVFILGINLEFLEITFIVVPIFVPAMLELGFTTNEIIWFTVLMAVNLNMAFISPPVGFSLFYLQSVAPPEVKTADIHKGAIPFMVLQGVALIILGVFPQITQFSIDLFVQSGAS